MDIFQVMYIVAYLTHKTVTMAIFMCFLEFWDLFWFIPNFFYCQGKMDFTELWSAISAPIKLPCLSATLAKMYD